MTDTEPTSSIGLLHEIIEGAGTPYMHKKQDWVDIQVDKPLWERAREWLAWRRQHEELMPEYLLSGERRADVWAQQFAHIFPAPDEEVMLSWFANAIMAGYDWGRSLPGAMITRARLEELAEASHNEYEIQAEIHGWKTQDASRKPWVDVPEENKETVRATIMAVVNELGLSVV